MVDFIIEKYSSVYNLLNENPNDQCIILFEKYFFNNVNDSKNLSFDMIRRFNLHNNLDINSSNHAVKTRNNITDYFAIPFLIIQRILDSIDGEGCIIGRMKLTHVLW